MSHDPKHLPRTMHDLAQRIGEAIQDDFTFCDWRPQDGLFVVEQDGEEYHFWLRRGAPTLTPVRDDGKPR